MPDQGKEVNMSIKLLTYKTATLFVLTGPLLFSGCNFPEPEITKIEPYLKRVEPLYLSETQSSKSQVDQNDSNDLGKALTLDDCVVIALDKNPLQRAAKEGVAAAKAIVGQTRSSYYPQIDATGGYSRWERHIFLPEGLTKSDVPSTVGPSDDWSASLNLRYNLFDSGKRRAELMAALAQQQASEQTAHQIRQDIILNVYRSYYGYLAALDANKIAEQNLKRADNHFQIAENRYAAGQIPQAEVLRVKVDVSDSKLSLVRTQSMIRVAQAQLNVAMGLPAEMLLEIHGNQEMITAPDEEKAQSAISRIKEATKEFLAGELVQGRVSEIRDFGAIINLGGRKEGLLHISELAPRHVAKVEDVVHLGDVLKLKIKKVEPNGKISLSLKDASDENNK